MRERLARRAAATDEVRRFFAERGVVEVSTDLIYPRVPTDPEGAVFRAVAEDGTPAGWLQPSPEFAMKRLLSTGCGDIYQICKAFRAGESGPRHRIEFTLVEWYRVGWDYRALAVEAEALIASLVPPCPVTQVGYAALWRRHLDLDPFAFERAELRNRFRSAGRTIPTDLDDRQLRALAFVDLIEPKLPSGMVTIFDFPAEQTAMAQCCEDRRYACRFEILVDGVELANGYQELTDAAQQRDRFVSDNETRAQRGLPARELDETLLNAMGQPEGLPRCAGVALGLDRLLMVREGRRDLGIWA